MAFQLSPSVQVTERDLTNIIPSVSTSTAALAGEFIWGPALQITTIDSEDDLVSTFGKPTNLAYKDHMTASSFLAYASNLKVIRAIDEATALNSATKAVIDSNGQAAGILVKNRDHYDSITMETAATDTAFIARHPGALGNSIGVAWADTSKFNEVDSNNEPVWPWHDLFDSAPGTNELHIVVYDGDGTLSGTQNTALERYPFTSTVVSAKYFDGTSGYYKNRVNNASKWVFVGDKNAIVGTSHDGILLENGTNGTAISDANRQAAILLFADGEKIDISLIMAGGASTTTAKFIIDNVAETRKDCVAMVSPAESDVVNIFNNDDALANILDTRTQLGSSSYAVMDSAWKLMYDRYNDVNRWVPLNGDIAGLCARTDNEADPWFSPAGLNRGRIKNAIALSNDEPLAIRDELYKKGVNPCVVFPVDGPVLFGDKTLLSKPSAFDRINVRRLFIVLEKAIATASKHLLFEQNDLVTRTLFVNMVEPFLRDVQGRRGITEFRVIADETNNTPQVIDSNQFVADIYIKPTRSINFIRLNFVAVRSGVDFTEIVQQ